MARPSAESRRSGLGRGLPQRDLEQVGHGVGAELFHDVGAVRLDRLDADAQVVGDLLVQAAGDDALQHLGFAGGQARQQGLAADDALMAVFRTTFGYSDEFSNMDVDQQARIIGENMELSDLQDPAKLERFLQRYSAMYDTENATSNSPALSILSGGSAGISADLLFSLAQLKA